MKINCYPTPTFQLQLWSDRYVYMLMFRGAGCIFIEMLQGSPAFPGVADVFEQLLKIWAVSLFVRMYQNCVRFLFYPCIHLSSSFLLRSSGSRPRRAGQVSVIWQTINQVCAKSFFHLSLCCNLTDVSTMRGDFLPQHRFVSLNVCVCVSYIKIDLMCEHLNELVLFQSKEYLN